MRYWPLRHSGFGWKISNQLILILAADSAKRGGVTYEPVCRRDKNNENRRSKEKIVRSDSQRNSGIFQVFPAVDAADLLSGTPIFSYREKKKRIASSFLWQILIPIIRIWIKTSLFIPQSPWPPSPSAKTGMQNVAVR
jgi:hypothetical protein